MAPTRRASVGDVVAAAIARTYLAGTVPIAEVTDEIRLRPRGRASVCVGASAGHTAITVRGVGRPRHNNGAQCAEVGQLLPFSGLFRRT